MNLIGKFEPPDETLQILEAAARIAILLALFSLALMFLLSRREKRPLPAPPLERPVLHHIASNDQPDCSPCPPITGETGERYGCKADLTKSYDGSQKWILLANVVYPDGTKKSVRHSERSTKAILNDCLKWMECAEKVRNLKRPKRKET